MMSRIVLIGMVLVLAVDYRAEQDVQPGVLQSQTLRRMLGLFLPCDLAVLLQQVVVVKNVRRQNVAIWEMLKPRFQRFTDRSSTFRLPISRWERNPESLDSP